MDDNRKIRPSDERVQAVLRSFRPMTPDGAAALAAKYKQLGRTKIYVPKTRSAVRKVQG